jgi:exodeoxyribonuclease VII large subunit
MRGCLISSYMNINILKKLKQWRDETAKKEGVENYRVIPNSAIEEIARLLPRSKEELTNIKGIKDKKFYKYGRDIFDIIGDSKDGLGNSRDASGNIFSKFLSDNSVSADRSTTDQEKIYSVSNYLDFLNEKLFMSGRIRIRGEITSVDIREKVVYFSLKDAKDESVINCLIFKYNYKISGISLEPGAEVVITSIPEIYKPMGRLSLKTSLIEIAGEGTLKRSYDELKAKLEKEGFFAPERKKPIPKLPETIGLITSNQGAAIGDFMTNIGNYGFKIKFINTSVEGKQAIFDLLNAIRTARKMDNIDVLAIVRGGGSLESLQAFNNEVLVRELLTLDVPVVCGVGHEKDISLVSLASDVSVSTPTAAAFAIRESWDDAMREFEYAKDTIMNSYGKILFENKYNFENNIRYGIRGGLDKIVVTFMGIISAIRSCEQKISSAISLKKERMDSLGKDIINEYEKVLRRSDEMIRAAESAVASNDPKRQLRLGYSISYAGGKILRSVKDVSKNDIIRTRLSDGTIDSTIKDITDD